MILRKERVCGSLHIKIRKGLDLPIAGRPEQVLYDGPALHSVALCGRDFGGIRPKMVVGEGDRVKLGEALFADRRNPDIRFVSPGSGSVEAIHYGPRRVLQSVVIRLEGDDEITFRAYPKQDLVTLSRRAVKENLLASGLWVALRTRPYGRIPTADTEPRAIFVATVDTNPLAADAGIILDECKAEFLDGLKVISRLTEGPVYLCQGPDMADMETWELGIPRLQVVRFEGPHPSGLVGTHIHFLEPVSARKTVWHLDYQDVIAIGRLFRTGRLSVERVIALGGPCVKRPRLLRTRLGANTEDLVTGELVKAENRIISGSVLSGRTAAGPESYLGRYHLQVSVITEAPSERSRSWLPFGRRAFSVYGSRVFSFFWRREHSMTTALFGQPAAMVSIGSFERFMPLDILPTPLLRALVVGDTEQAEALGCLELEEEDLALCTFLCPSKLNYGPLLRSVLNRIEKEGQI